MVGALMPAGMITPECPSFSSSAPPSEASATASPVSGEACLLAADPEDRPSPSPWQEKRGEVSEVTSVRGGQEGPGHCPTSFLCPFCLLL